MAVEVTESIDTFGNTVIHVKDPEKNKGTYSIVKSNDGFAFYQIKVDQGSVPKELSSMYTKTEQAEKDIKFYLSKKSPSNHVKRDTNTAEREARKKAKEEA